jgi:prevent-host-death family protein
MITIDNIIPFSQARANLSKVIEKAQAGQETIITRNGLPAAAVIDAVRYEHYQKLDRAHFQNGLLDDLEQGLNDIEAGNWVDARVAIAERKAAFLLEHPEFD